MFTLSIENLDIQKVMNVFFFSLYSALHCLERMEQPVRETCLSLFLYIGSGGGIVNHSYLKFTPEMNWIPPLLSIYIHNLLSDFSCFRLKLTKQPNLLLVTKKGLDHEEITSTYSNSL